MMDSTQNGTCALPASKLMERILMVRLTDPEEERELCKQLLDAAETEQDAYASAFANVYMLDSLLALGDLSSYGFYLARASLHCQDHDFDNLKVILCNLAGLYYCKLNDNQTALQYYLEGLRTARATGDAESESKLLNNIGFSFGYHQGWEEARSYFQLALDRTRELPPEERTFYAASYLCNLAEVCQNLGDTEAAERAMDLCEAQNSAWGYVSIRLGCARAVCCVLQGDRDGCVRAVDALLEMGFFSFEDPNFVCDMSLGLCENTLDVEDRERSRQFLDFLEEHGASALSIRFQSQRLEIRWQELFGTPEALADAYRIYYELERQVSAKDDEAWAQSILSTIQLYKVRQDRDTLRIENSALEHASQLDKLTGLYNRRYFDKLVTKLNLREDLHTLGFVMLDVDYFKQYNDFYGHFAGDSALVAVAEVLKSNSTQDIHAGRYGGDEFVCVCANLTDEELLGFVERVEEDLRGQALPHERSGCAAYLSLSIGYCNEPAVPGAASSRLLDLADQALYRAKEGGRNRHARL